MAKDAAERGAGRVLRIGGLVFLVLGALAAWSVAPGGLGAWYQLDPGEAAVILRLGKHVRTVAEPGFKLKIPAPIETLDKVNVGVSKRREFGNVDAADATELAETAMQTGDNNVVHVEFVVQYKVGDPYENLYRAADVDAILRDASQAAMREVVGRNTIDGVLSEQRGAVQADAEVVLQGILESYETGLVVQRVELQEVQPPAAVRDAFDDVIAASQDRNRQINEAQGYANEVLPQARAEALELIAQAEAYRDATIAEAKGEADQFLAVLAEYNKAKDITRTRLYLETMEEVLLEVDKILIEPGTASVLPYLPLGSERR